MKYISSNRACSIYIVCRIFWSFQIHLTKFSSKLKLAILFKKLSTTPNAYDTSQDNTNPTPTAPPKLHNLHSNHPLSLVPRKFRNTLAVTERVPRILVAGFFGVFQIQLIKFSSTLKLANIIKKLSTTPNANDTTQDKTNPTPTAPQQLHNLHNNHPLSLVPRKFRNKLAVTEHISQSLSYPQSLVSHIALHQPNIDDTIEQL